MNDADDFDVSQLRWWRCVSIEPNSGQIHTFIVEIKTDNIYAEFNKIRQDLQSKNLRFVEAKPISAEEQLASAKLSQFKKTRRERQQGLTGRRYSPFSHWPAVVSAVLLILLILLLAYLHSGT